MLISKAVCHPGLVRDQNEDSILCNEQERLWVVADGVGGNEGGQIASQIAVQTIERKYRQGYSLEQSMKEANQAVKQVRIEQPELSTMASTAVAVRFKGDDFELAWVGDSRAYLIEAQGMKQLTQDHNVATDLLRTGSITQEQWFDHEGQHELTQALGEMSLDSVPTLSGTLEANQLLLLCTDGLSGVLSNARLEELVSAGPELDEIAANLMSSVLSEGAPDNISFILIKQQADQVPVPDSANHLPHTENSGSMVNLRQLLQRYPSLRFLLPFVIIILVLFLMGVRG